MSKYPQVQLYIDGHWRRHRIGCQDHGFQQVPQCRPSLYLRRVCQTACLAERVRHKETWRGPSHLWDLRRQSRE